MNGTFWAAYGALVGNWFIIIPNGLATMLGIFQLIVRRVVGVKEDEMPAINTDDHSHHNGSDDDHHLHDGAPLLAMHHRSGLA